MCGIAGIARTEGWVDLDLLIRMRDSMEHRGPDDAGVWCSKDRRVGLANRRLAIIDLSPGGHQPLGDERCSLTFNGEIYNHRALRRDLERQGHSFASTSDTEVLLQAYRAWGPDCLDRLRGAFAFAIYDADTRRLFLARDRAGEKPLFYRHHAGKFVFASELKALLHDPGCPREGDLAALDFYLAYGYVPGERCLLKGYRKLPPGCAITYDVDYDTLRIRRYWELPAPAPDGGTEEELVERLEALLVESVAEQLAADVPVGIMLSGGIDSSLVTALAVRVPGAVAKTFTVAFPGDDAYDESTHARAVAQHFGTDHTEISAEPATVELLPRLARQFDEPIGDSSLVPTYLVSALIRDHAKVALGGDGGDELFGGYLHYTRLLQQVQVRRLLPGPMRRYVRAAAERRLPTGMKGRNYALGLGAALGESLTHLNIVFDAADRSKLLEPLGLERNGQRITPEVYKATLWAGSTPLERASRVDFLTYLPDDILVKVDRASMLASLEVRAPWLDHKIIEFAFGAVPERLRATLRRRKVLPSVLARRLLPPGLDVGRKKGFSVPMASWLRGRWGAFVEDVLLDGGATLFDRTLMSDLVSGQRRGYSNSQRLFALTMFELWRREYGIDGFS